MTRTGGRTTAVNRSKATVYLRRARNLLSMMEQAHTQANCDSTAALGIQAAIALSDAFTISKLGLRSRGQAHPEVVGLISQVRTASAVRLATLVQAVVGRKSELEYGERDVSESDALEIANLVRKISHLVSSELG